MPGCEPNRWEFIVRCEAGQWKGYFTTTSGTCNSNYGTFNAATVYSLGGGNYRLEFTGTLLGSAGACAGCNGRTVDVVMETTP